MGTVGTVRSVYPRRSGFSILEIIVAVGMMAIIAAAVFSALNLETSSDAARIADVSNKLDDLRQAIAGNEITLPAKSFRQTVGVFPGALHDLTSALTSLNAAVSKNSCGQAYTATNANNAASAGPYYLTELAATGTKLVTGFIANDAIVRAGPAATTRSTLAIQFQGVTLADAQALDQYMDGITDGTDGAIRYSSTDPTTTSFLIAVRGC